MTGFSMKCNSALKWVKFQVLAEPKRLQSQQAEVEVKLIEVNINEYFKDGFSYVFRGN